MTYEYRTQVYVGSIPPDVLKPPDGFRLREIRYVETGSVESHVTGWEYANGGRIPFTQSVGRTTHGQWVAIWERYVPDKEEE